MDTLEGSQEMALIIAALPDKERQAMETILKTLTIGKSRKLPRLSKNLTETGKQ